MQNGDIPHIIHFMWYSKDETVDGYPQRYEKYIESWKKYNPDYEFIFWNNKKIHSLWDGWENKKMSDFFYNKLRHIEKCDFTRYLIMYLYGGVYVDMNTMCYKNISPLLKGRTFGLVFEPIEHNEIFGYEYLLTNSFLSSVPGEEFWLDFMEYIMKHYWSTKHEKDFVMINTGPYIFARFAIKHLQPKDFISGCLAQPFVNQNAGNDTVSRVTKECKDVHVQPYFAKHWKDSAQWGDIKDTETKPFEKKPLLKKRGLQWNPVLILVPILLAVFLFIFFE